MSHIKTSDDALRPVKLDEIIGQQEVRDRIKVCANAAASRMESMEHCLLMGPPGLGKTTLARAVATEMGSQFIQINGAAIETTKDVGRAFLQIKRFGVLFIDEIHRIPKQVMEFIYTAMEDYLADIDIGDGRGLLRWELPKFCLIGATTHAGKLNLPLLSRFTIKERLEYYKPEELAQISVRASEKLGFDMDIDGAFEIGRRARGTPRIALGLTRRVRDYMEVGNIHLADAEAVKAIVERLGIDADGLDNLDRKVLRCVLHQFEGGPVGVNSLASTLGEEPESISQVVEPYLLHLGYLVRTPSGRVITQKGKARIK